jgi:hypothetical protein
MRAMCIKPIDRISRPASVRQSSPAGAPQNEHRMRNRCSMRLRIARFFSACAGVPITSPPASIELIVQPGAKDVVANSPVREAKLPGKGLQSSQCSEATNIRPVLLSRHVAVVETAPAIHRSGELTAQLLGQAAAVRGISAIE